MDWAKAMSPATPSSVPSCTKSPASESIETVALLVFPVDRYHPARSAALSLVAAMTGWVVAAAAGAEPSGTRIARIESAATGAANRLRCAPRRGEGDRQGMHHHRP